MGCGQEDGQGDRQPPGTKHPHGIHRQEHHESQETFEIVIVSVFLFTNKAKNKKMLLHEHNKVTVFVFLTHIRRGTI